MNLGDAVMLTLEDGHVFVQAVLDDRVLPDRTCGQWDSGWVAYSEELAREWFLSVTGDVYRHGTDEVVGVCKLIADAYALVEAY